MAAPDRKRGGELLERHWREVAGGDGPPDIPDRTRHAIAQLIASETVAFSYCLPTQLLGKLTDHRFDALCLQRGDNGESQWDPRGFAASVVVPWVTNNQNVLGNSHDPYVSNPLRQPRILAAPPNVKANTLPLWSALHGVLSEVEVRDNPDYTRDVFRAVLQEIYDKLQSQQFEYPVLGRPSLEQILYLVSEIIGASQAGEHAMSVVAALLSVVGRRFGLWDQVNREASTTTDQASGMVGDIECRREGRLVFAVEVKERHITLADVRSFEAKLARKALTEALLSAPGPSPAESEDIRKRVRLMWRQGTNLYQYAIESLVGVLMSLAGETGRKEFIEEIGKQLDRYAKPAGRLAWSDLLNGVLDGGSEESSKTPRR